MVDRTVPRLPGAPASSGADRIVCHVDVDCFYAACERRREPELEGEPVVVGMGYEAGESHGAVATASYEARRRGIESAQAISTALERLPRAADADSSGPVGHYRPVDMAFYESVSEDVREVLDDCADTVRAVSIDEAYLDVTDRTAWERVGGDADDGRDGNDTGGGAEGSGRSGGRGDRRTLAEGYARHVKARIAEAAGVTASVGVAPTMSAAKVASDHDKPDGLVVVEPGSVREFFAPLSVETLHGVGPVTARELRGMGIETAGDLAGTEPDRIAARFGERGREVHAFARGEDDREVTPVGRPKSLSRESAFTEATTDPETKRERVETLAGAVAERAARKGVLYGTIGIKVVTPPFSVQTRTRSLSGPVEDPALLREVALDLLSEFRDAAVRKLGVRVSKLAFTAAEQSSLDGFEPDDAGTAPATTARTDPGDVASGGTEASGGTAAADLGRYTAAGAATDAAGSDGTTGPEGGRPPTEGQTSLVDFRVQDG
jgi:DNA polymerase IV (DinB-like DNA polymerase)